ncbi:MAG TPA: thiamine pyrophosphate-binding protein [Alphaproteobacteria bacterium]|nr:thiamine pyrophosphate-binding protein [Alphaproteobacteria bacterium]
MTKKPAPAKNSKSALSIDRPVKLKARRNRPEYGSDAMAEVLRGLGFKYAFLNPGSSYRGLHDSLINYNGNENPLAVLCSHEDIAVGMGHGYANATGRSSLVILHDLVGLMHGVMGVYNAWCARAPVVVLGGSGPSDPKLRRAIDYLHSANVQGELIRPFVKWDDEATTVEGVLDGITRANKIAQTGPTGPVYVSVDAGLQEEKLDREIEIPSVTDACYQPADPSGANPEALREAVDILLKAKNPIVTANRIGFNPKATKPLVALVEALGCMYIDDRGFVCLPSRHPHNLTGDRSAMNDADVILGVDMFDLSNTVDAYSSRVRGEHGAGAGNRKIIDLSQNDLAIRSWSRLGGMVAPTTLQVLADPVVGLQQMLQEVKARVAKDTALAKRIQARAKAVAARKADLLAKQQKTIKERWNEKPISPHRLVSELWAVVKNKPWFLTLRNHRNWPEGVWEFGGCGEFVGHSGGGGVGHGPGAMIGAAFAARDRGQFAVAVVGDGDMQMSTGALWTAAHYKVPLLVIINNNLSWYNDEEHQGEVARMRGRPPENAWIGTTTRAPEVNFSDLVRGYGCWAEDGPITDPNGLAPALKRAVKQVEAGKCAVLDVRCKPR